MRRKKTITCHIEERLLDSGRTGLYIRYTIGGKRYREALELHLDPGSDTRTKQRNKRILQEAELRVAQRQIDLNAGGGSVGRYDGDRIALMTYVDEMIAIKKNVTWRSLRKHLEDFRTPLGLRLSDVNSAWVDSFKMYLLEKTDLAPNSAERYMAHLHTLFHHAQKEHLVRENPCAYVDRIRVQRTQREFLTVEEVQLLAQTPCRHADVRRAFLFACATGLRYSDVVALTWENVRDDRLYFRAQKTRRVQFLPLNATALQLLPSGGPADGFLFAIPRNTSVNRILKIWAAAAGITKNLSFHIARHTYATIMLNCGMELNELQEYLGHSRIETTAIYAQLSVEKLKRKNDLFPIIDLQPAGTEQQDKLRLSESLQPPSRQSH